MGVTPAAEKVLHRSALDLADELDAFAEGCPWGTTNADYVCEEEENLARCDYYQDCGICTFGCWDEPSCMTSGPWPDPCFTPAEANSIVIRRYAYKMQRWWGWHRLAEWMSTPSGCHNGSSDVDPR
jgi:hypothetical protein